MELRHLRYFLAVAEEENITRAAERLAIAQPPLTRQIKDLEEELGVLLFERKRNGLRLTEEGEHFLNYARQILRLEEKAKEEVRQLDQGLQGVLHLDSVDGQGPRLLAGWLAGFHKLYPCVQFDLWKGNSDEVQRRVSKGLSDIGIILQPYNGIGFQGVPIYREPWVALMPSDHPLAQKEGDTISCQELSEYELIIPARDSRKKEIEGWFAQSGSSLKVIGRMAHVTNAYELAANHLGISIYPAAAADVVRGREVCAKQLTDPVVYADYVLIRSSERELSPASEMFWNYVMKQL